ncbi:hypothetical protein [Streptomyces sp. NPDC086787]|uniref:hypothetical protein n=1 Tax=Streptomyces sp. NPDC086787 TaxID=3365759 RepID=UPI00382D8285
MNGYGLAAVIVASVAAVAVALLWALVRVAQQREAAEPDDQTGGADPRQRLAEAVERAKGERRGSF